MAPFKTSAGAMFSSHYEGLGHSLFTPKLASGTHCAPGTLFFILLAPLLVSKELQGRPRDIKQTPKGLPKLPGDTQNLLEIDVGLHLGIQRGPGISRGTPGTENDTQIDEKTIKKCQHSALFFLHFWCDARRHSTQKMRVFRAGSYTFFV